MRIPFALLAPLVACLFNSCATPGSWLAATSESSWESERFSVKLSVGETREDWTSSSHYEVVPKRLGAEGKIVASSAHSTGGFRCVNNPAPTNYTKVLADSEQDALIIQEIIPNDCGPCTNYLWIRPSGPTAFTVSYLQLPSGSLGIPGGIDYVYPEVFALRNGILTYRYTSGKKVTVDVDSVPSLNKPTPPG